MMNPGEESGEQSKPAAEAPGGGQGNSGPRRRGGRGGRGRGRGRGFGARRPGDSTKSAQDGPAAEEARPVHPGDSHGAPKNASLHDVIKQVERIRGDLSRVLEDMNHVLHLLDQIERENNASEQEIHKLRDSLYSLRGHGNPSPRAPRRPEPQPASVPTEESERENETAEEWD